MSWRDFKPYTPIDKIDKIDKMPLPGHIVDIVDIVERGEVSKSVQKESPHSYPPGGSNRVAEPAMTVAWTNPHPKGSQAARDFSRKAIEEARGLN